MSNSSGAKPYRGRKIAKVLLLLNFAISLAVAFYCMCTGQGGAAGIDAGTGALITFAVTFGCGLLVMLSLLAWWFLFSSVRRK